MIEAVIAFLAGTITVLSPCVWPLLPIILGTSLVRGHATRPLFIAAGFIASFAATALLVVTLTQALGLPPDATHTAGVVILFALGLMLIIPSLFGTISGPLSGIVNRAVAVGARAGAGNAGGLLVGLTLGVVWTPCAGPTLGSILTLIATRSDVARGAALITAFALGSALPMIAIAYGGQRLVASSRGLAPYTRPLQAGFGVLIVLVSIAIYFDYDVLLNAEITNALSRFTQGTPS